MKKNLSALPRDKSTLEPRHCIKSISNKSRNHRESRGHKKEKKKVRTLIRERKKRTKGRDNGDNDDYGLLQAAPSHVNDKDPRLSNACAAAAALFGGRSRRN